MSTLKELKAKDSNIVRIHMSEGTLPIDSAYPTWVNPTTKVINEGITLTWSSPVSGYVELNLNDAHDRKVYARFKEWMAEGTDWRIAAKQVYEIEEGEAAAPFPWWDTSNAEKLLGQVIDAVEALPTVDKRKTFVEQCVLYETQNKNRKVFVEKLMNIDLDVAAADELDPDA